MQRHVPQALVRGEPQKNEEPSLNTMFKQLFSKTAPCATISPIADEMTSEVGRKLETPMSSHTPITETPTGVDELCPSPIRRMNSTDEFHQEMRDVFKNHFVTIGTADATKILAQWILKSSSSQAFQVLLDGFTEITLNAYLQMELPWYQVDNANDYTFHLQENGVSFSIGVDLYNQCFLKDPTEAKHELFSWHHYLCHYQMNDDNTITFQDGSKGGKNTTNTVFSLSNEQKILIQQMLRERKILEERLSSKIKSQSTHEQKEVRILTTEIMNINNEHIDKIQKLLEHKLVIQTQPITPEEFTSRFDLFTVELCRLTFAFVNSIITNSPNDYLKDNAAMLFIHSFSLAFKSLVETYQECSVDYFKTHLSAFSAHIMGKAETYFYSQLEMFKQNDLDYPLESSKSPYKTLIDTDTQSTHVLDFQWKHAFSYLKADKARADLEREKAHFLAKWAEIVSQLQEQAFIEEYNQDFYKKLQEKESDELKTLNAAQLDKKFNAPEFRYSQLMPVEKLHCLFEILLSEYSLKDQLNVIKRSCKAFSQQLQKEQVAREKERAFAREQESASASVTSARRDSFSNTTGILSVSTSPRFFSPINLSAVETAANGLSEDFSDLSPIIITFGAK